MTGCPPILAPLVKIPYSVKKLWVASETRRIGSTCTPAGGVAAKVLAMLESPVMATVTAKANDVFFIIICV